MPTIYLIVAIEQKLRVPNRPLIKSLSPELYIDPLFRNIFKKSLNYKGSQDLVKICSRRIKWC